jgi:hypothetical protein
MILTPRTNKLLIQAMLKAGYIEQPEWYPVVAELPDCFLYITGSECGKWLVSKFYTDFMGDSLAEADTMEGAIEKFHTEYLHEMLHAQMK